VLFWIFFAEVKFFCQTPAIADIVILVDGSWSIGRFNFRLVRLFLENLVTAFNVGSEKTRVGMSVRTIVVSCQCKTAGEIFKKFQKLFTE
jgi:hypothetical protein